MDSCRAISESNRDSEEQRQRFVSKATQLGFSVCKVEQRQVCTVFTLPVVIHRYFKLTYHCHRLMLNLCRAGTSLGSSGSE
jgi:hypothetical protein